MAIGRTGKRSTTAVLCVVLLGLAGCTAVPERPDAGEAGFTTLRLARTGSFADVQIEAFSEAVATDSGGALEISIAEEYETDTNLIEEEIVAAVAAGEVDLGWIGSRVFAGLGVHDLDALTAPMLIDSLDAERAVLDSGIAAEMLPSLDELGVVGLAVMGGSLRHPIAVEAPVRGVADYAGLPFHVFHGEGASETLALLGAVPVDVPPPQRDSGLLDGSIGAFENSVPYFASSFADKGTPYLTVDVALWPSMGVLIADPEALASLDEPAREALTGAAEQTAERSVDLVDDEGGVIAAACAEGATFAQAGADAVAELRTAVEPEHARLAEWPESRGFLDRITEIVAEVDPVTPEIPADCSG